MNTEKQKVLNLPTPVIIAAFLIIIGGIMYAASFFTSLLMAVFISIICYEPIAWLQKKKVPGGLAVGLVLIAIIGLFVVFGGIIGKSLSSFSENLPEYKQSLDAIGNSVQQLLNEAGINISTDKLAALFGPSKIMDFTAKILGQLGGFMGNVLTILLLALFLLLEVDSIAIKTEAILKDAVGSIAYMNKIGSSIRHYLSIKTVTSLLTAVCIWIGLLILGVDYAILWALLAFLLNYIPNIGSIIAGIPPVLFALIQLGFGGALWTMIIFIAVNMVIGNAVEPKMMGKGMGLSTFVVFLALLFWGFILGTVGMFLSVPLTMAIKIMLEQNPKTAWIAIMLGTSQDAQAVIDNDQRPAAQTE
jgi:AI-2 transport protein TqsA